MPVSYLLMFLASASRQSQAQCEDSTGQDLFLMDNMQLASLFLWENAEGESWLAMSV